MSVERKIGFTALLQADNQKLMRKSAVVRTAALFRLRSAIAQGLKTDVVVNKQYDEQCGQINDGIAKCFLGNLITIVEVDS